MNTKNLVQRLSLASLVVGATTMASAVGATTAPDLAANGLNTTLTRPEGTSSNLFASIQTISNYAVGIAAVIAVLIVIYGGITYLTSGGSDDGTSKAKKIISSGIIGLVICALAYALVLLVANILRA